MRNSVRITFILFFYPLLLLSQQTYPDEKILQVQTNERGDVFYLVQQKAGFDSIRFHETKYLLQVRCITEPHAPNSVILLDTMAGNKWGWSYHGLGLLFKGVSLEQPNIYFIDNTTGFIYGNEKGYGAYPFVLRTNDGGKSWKAMDSLVWGGHGIQREDFAFLGKQYLFILLPEIDWRNKIHYAVSYDLGEHWVKKIIVIENNNYELYGCGVQASQNGVITLTAFMSKVNDTEKHIIFQSRDYGNSFRVYK
jgi:hypothetical protein